MPSLKDLNCAIELSPSQQALREFGTIYGDGFVETFVPVPSEQQSFSIHLTSNKFIAPGVAIFVYVDGVYQCNRNRQELKLRKPSGSRSLVDFRMRQKEERQEDGSMIAREWAFDKLNIASADDAPDLCSPNILQNIGCIEVVVLRCAGTRSAKFASTMNFDGAGDYPDRRYDFDETSSPSNERSMYDDRGPFYTNAGNGYGPLPPISSYRSPYAETLRSQEGSASRSRRTTHTPHELFPPAASRRRSQPRPRYSEPISPGARRKSDLPASVFQYGSGPILRDEEKYNRHPSNAGATQHLAVDPMWLNNLLTTAVRQGVVESRRMDVQSEEQARRKEKHDDAMTTSQPPGAWPESPFDASKLPHHQSEPAAFSRRDQQSNQGSQRSQSQIGWGERKARSRIGTHVTWNNEPADETASSSVGGWNLREETPSDSWDTGDTWPTDRIAEWDASSQLGKSWAKNPPSHYNARPISSVPPRPRDRARSKHSSQRKPRSKSRSKYARKKHDITSSSEDNGSWSYLDRPSDCVASPSSSDDTLQPSQSRSRIQTPRRRSKSRSRRSKSVQREHERNSSKQSHLKPTWRPAASVSAFEPSVMTLLTPTVINAPISTPLELRSRQPSAHASQPAAVLPLPEWASQVQDAMRKPSIAASTLAPPPYAQSLRDLVQSTTGEMRGGNRSCSSSSWGNGKRDCSRKAPSGKGIEKDAGWSKKSDSGWQDKTPKQKDQKGWYSTDDDTSDSWAKDHHDKTTKVANDWATKESGWGTKPSPTKEKKDATTDDFAALKAALGSALEKPPAIEIPWQNQSWTLPATNAARPAPQHAPPPPSACAPAPTPSSSKQPPRINNKPLSQYRPNHSFLQPAPSPTKPPERKSTTSLSQYRPNSKPTWQFPPPPSTPIALHSTSIAPAEPRLTISQNASLVNGIEHAVRPGKATQYGHVIGRPQYLDGLDRPYAVFRFKYRSGGMLERMFGGGVRGSAGEEGREDVVMEKMGVLGAQTKDGEGMPEPEREKEGQRGISGVEGGKEKEKEKDTRRRGSTRTDGAARNFTEWWVERHSRDQSGSVLAKSLGREKSGRREKEKEAQRDGEVGTWG